MLPPARISLLALDVIWEHLDLGERPTPLITASPGATWTERNALVEQTWDELAGIGWVRQGRLTGEVCDLFALLARPARELYGWAGTQDGPATARLVASRGEDAVLADVGPETVEIRGIRVGNAAESLVDTLPVLRKASGSPLNFPADALTQAPAPTGILSTNHGSTTLDRVHAVFARPRLGGAQLYAAHRDDLGKRTRNPRKITVLDTVDGRWSIRERNGDGELWLSLVPTDRDSLVRAVVELGAG
ncbi:hypothetical protein GCM10027047_03240 [Rhodococcus aerolatus]